MCMFPPHSTDYCSSNDSVTQQLYTCAVLQLKRTAMCFNTSVLHYLQTLFQPNICLKVAQFSLFFTRRTQKCNAELSLTAAYFSAPVFIQYVRCHTET